MRYSEQTKVLWRGEVLQSGEALWRGEVHNLNMEPDQSHTFSIVKHPFLWVNERKKLKIMKFSKGDLKWLNVKLIYFTMSVFPLGRNWYGYKTFSWHLNHLKSLSLSRWFRTLKWCRDGDKSSIQNFVAFIQDAEMVILLTGQHKTI